MSTEGRIREAGQEDGDITQATYFSFGRSESVFWFARGAPSDRSRVVDLLSERRGRQWEKRVSVGEGGQSERRGTEWERSDER